MVADHDSLLDGAARIQPTLVVVDVALAGGNLERFLAALKRLAPVVKVLLVTAYDEPMLTAAALAAGADGVIRTRAVAADLPQAVKAVLAGGRYPSPCESSAPTASS
jgi:DNA-binding NarL/FixJ family response regulator